MTPAAILDIDGTLVDTNYQHALAWYMAFRQSDIDLPVWRIHRHIGMGGDQMVAALAGDRAEHELGEEIRSAEKALYLALIQSTSPFPGARELVVELCDRGIETMLASSAKSNEVDHYLDLLDVRDVVSGWTTSADVEKTKPEPDLVVAALDKLDAEHAVMIGDTPWDVLAAQRAGVQTLAVRTGGFSEQELSDAGAAEVFESVEELLDQLDHTPFAAEPAQRSG